MKMSVAVLFLSAWIALAQPPGGGGRSTTTVDTFVARMLEFDKNKDGKLSRAEVTDERLLRLFDKADVNHDGVVTKQELTAVYGRETEGISSGGPGGPGFGPGGPARGGPGRGNPPQAFGQIVPSFAQQQMQFTVEQTKALDALQHEVDVRLDKILTKEQKAVVEQMKSARRGPPDGPPPPGER